MFHLKRKVFSAGSLNWLTPEQVAETLRETPGRPLCQAFLVDVDGLQLVMLNDSNDPTATIYWQEYAIVLPDAPIEIPPGASEVRIKGEQIESFTTNGMSSRELVKSLRSLTDPARHCRLTELTEYGRLDVALQAEAAHQCRFCE